MKRLIYDVPRWHCFLHRDARGMEPASSTDPPLPMLADELFDRLYAGDSSELGDAANQKHVWAKQFHESLGSHPEYLRLAQEVRGDPFAAALATEKLLDELKPEEPQAQQATSPTPRQVGHACTEAASSVEEHRESISGLSGVGFGSSPGDSTGQTDGRAQRELSQRLKQDARLRRISLLAGRFKQIAATKRRQKTRHGVDEVADVELGGDIARLLPSELARFAHPKLRLALLRDLSEQRAMQYRLSGAEKLGQGQLIVCLDKSGSMEGQADIWATAIALALLEVAQAERRTFGLICFDAGLRYEAVVRPGELLPAEALFVAPSGGTDLSLAVTRGLELVEQGSAGKLGSADIILVTDGISDSSSSTQLRDRADKLGCSILGVGIGVEPQQLSPWCDLVESARDLNNLEPTLADSLFSR